MFHSKDEDPLLGKRFSRRSLLLALGLAGGFALLAQHLFRLQVLQQRQYAPLADDNRTNLQLLAPERGRILDRFGEVLASSRPNLRVMLANARPDDVPMILDRLSRILPLTEADKDRVLARARKQARSQPITIANDLSWQQFTQINVLAPQLPGVQTEVAAVRQYFHGRAAGHVVGYVGQIERIAADDDPVLRLPGIRVGKSGIERGLDKQLRGEAGTAKFEVDARGRIVRNLDVSPAQRGRDVILTLDTHMQERVMKRLAGERRAAVVALHIATGDVVVMASVPSFDPADVISGMSEAQWAQQQNAADEPLTNRAIRGQYPPGSTYKMVTALAGLESEVISPGTHFSCSGRYVLAESVFRCWKRTGHGSVDLHRALRESCDCYFYETARRVGVERLAQMGRRLGFGQIYDSCGLPLQKSGVVPDPDWKMGHFSKPWIGGETVLAGIGQGYVLATPLQLAVMTARIASGRAIVPRLVRPDAGAAETTAEPLGVKPAHLDAIRRGLVAAVNDDRGTGSSAQLTLKGFKLAGKTGTAQVSRASADRNAGELEWHSRDHALFVGYAPVGTPRYAVAAIVEHGGGGSLVAAPLVRDVMTDLLAHDPVGKPLFEPGPSAEREAGVRRGGPSG